MPGKLTGAFLLTTTAYMWLGEVVDEDERFIYLRNASRVFNDGRFGSFVRNGVGEGAEIEFAGAAEVRIPQHSVSDVVEWLHALPAGDQ
jgi:hypothetical protein